MKYFIIKYIGGYDLDSLVKRITLRSMYSYIWKKVAINILVTPKTRRNVKQLSDIYQKNNWVSKLFSFLST